MRCAPLAACAAHRLPHALRTACRMRCAPLAACAALPETRRMRRAPLGSVSLTLRCAALRARQAVPLLIELMKDAVPQVKDTAAWCMCRICELHTPSIQDDNKMQVVMNVLVLGLADHAKVARWCVGALNVLTEHFADDAEVRCSLYYTIRCRQGSALPLLGASAAVSHCLHRSFRPPTTACLRRGAVRCGAV
jgi:hypothetical protein